MNPSTPNLLQRLFASLGLNRPETSHDAAPRLAPAPLKAKEIDRVIDAARQVAQERRDAGELPLPEVQRAQQSGPFKSQDHFFNSAFTSFRELIQFTRITPRTRVLDFGCGLARLAIPLSAYLDPAEASYCGVDTDAECVRGNREVFAAFPHFRFEHVNIFSTMYNPDGEPFEKLQGRDFGAPFDLAMLFSVFTHILPEHCDLLLELLRSQLLPGGELLTTWFLLNPATERAIAEGRADRDFRAYHGVARIASPHKPEGAVAYEERDVLERMAQAGFGKPSVIYGNWRGNNDAKNYQDILVAPAIS